MNYEQRVIEVKAALNDSTDAYFGPRPQRMRTRKEELLFAAGFRMAWEYISAPQEAEG